MAGGLSANTKASLIAMNAPFAFPTSVTELFSEPFRSPHGLSVVNIIALARSAEHTSELQSLMRISYAVFCLTKKITYTRQSIRAHTTHDKHRPFRDRDTPSNSPS